MNYANPYHRQFYCNFDLIIKFRNKMFICNIQLNLTDESQLIKSYKYTPAADAYLIQHA